MAIVRNSAGIHCRPSACIIKAASRIESRITVFSGDTAIDLTSMLALVALGLERGAEVRICVEGKDEAAHCAQLVELFEREFDFPPLAAEERAEAAARMLSDD